MQTHIEKIDPKILLQVDKAAHVLWEHSFRAALGSGIWQGNVRAMLADPLLRPMLEINENGATNYENALMLTSLGFLASKTERITTGQFTGARLQCISLTDHGRQYISNWQDAMQSVHTDATPHPFDVLLRFIRSYLVIDRGSGIVATTGVANFALKLNDRRILSRIVSIENAVFQFDLGTLARDAPETAWMKLAGSWSNTPVSSRTGASVVDLFDTNYGQCSSGYQRHVPGSRMEVTEKP